MTSFVLDASVALAWFLDKPLASYAASVNRRLLNGARALVPALWHLEMANGLAVAERRKMLTPEDVDRSLLRIEGLISESVETDTSLSSSRETHAVARAQQLTAYDAVYVCLAQRARLPLATLDGPLRSAASRAGVPLIR